MALVYKITNKNTNKCYIGYTSKSLEQRIYEHFYEAKRKPGNRKFYNAIKKHNEGCCWIFEVLENNINVANAKKLEIEYIKLYDSYNNGYNSTKGGDGNNGIVMSDESNNKRRLALKGKSKNYDRMKNKKHSEESKEKISNSHKGMKKPWVKWNKDQIVKRAMTRRSITEDQYNKIHELKSKNIKIKEIAQEVNLSCDMVKKWSKLEWAL